MRLEEIAPHDDYSIERKLYPNGSTSTHRADLRAMGFPTKMFTVLFALGRLPGWIAQWREMIDDTQTKIGRPRQVYTGATERDYPRSPTAEPAAQATWTTTSPDVARPRRASAGSAVQPGRGGSGATAGRRPRPPRCAGLRPGDRPLGERPRLAPGGVGLALGRTLAGSEAQHRAARLAVALLPDRPLVDAAVSTA
jgi:hypothetical protein